MFKKQIFGLDISDHSIEALLINKSLFRPIKITSYARTLLPGEVVKDGIVKNPDKLVENIKKLLQSAKPKPIKTPYCILSLPESQVFTTIFKLPAGLKYKEIKNTIPYKAEEVIPFKPTEIYFDFKTIAVMDATQEVFYAAVPMKTIDGYIEVLKKAGLKPVAFDLESTSLARAVLPQKKKFKGTKLLIDIGARTTSLNIIDSSGVRQNLTIKTAGDHFTKAIAKNLKITEKQANELKMKNGFDSKKQKSKALSALQDKFKRVITETKKLIDFYQTENQKQIDEVILLGGSALLPKLDQYLADNLKIKVNLANPLVKIADPKNLTKFKNKAILFTNAVGLARRGASKNPANSDINLLPVHNKKFSLLPAKGEKKNWRQVYIRLTILVVVILILTGVFFFRQKGFDFYNQVFSPSQYKASMDSGVDPEIFDWFRKNALDAEVTEETIEPENIVPDQDDLGLDGLNKEDKLDPEVLGQAIELDERIKVKEGDIGYLNVREGPGTDYDKVGKVLPGEEFDILAFENDWYKIAFSGKNEGWVYFEYVDKLE